MAVGPLGARALWSREIDLTEYVLPGDTVAWSHAGAEPRGVLAQLLDQRHKLGGINAFLTGVSFGGALSPEHADVIGFRGIGGLGTHRALANAGVLDVLPCRYADLPRLIDDGTVRVDVVVVAGSLPDADGRLSLGPTVAVSHELLARARTTIVEINPNIPFVLGDTLVPIDAFDRIVYSELDPVVMPTPPAPTEGTRRICELIAELVPDGATTQMGIGSIAQGLPACLARHRHLGVHSAILTDGVMELIRSGVVDGSGKERDQGLAVGGELIGSSRLYEFAGRNPAIALHRSSDLLAEATLGSFDRLISINSALQVDLTGQVNAEAMGAVPVGAVGGQVDFVRGAARSRLGRSVIALPATTSAGVSRIVPRLDSGVVTTARSEVDRIVTEYGVAELRGATLSERARALIAIADPAHRAALRAASLC
ncbi:MAG TPA: acetyl-CoA hydrolase/transferase C-terminal domain-containing protein [Pseudonocardia sp.]